MTQRRQKAEEEVVVIQIMSDNDYLSLAAYQQTLVQTRNQLQLMEIGYNKFAEEVKEKYHIDQKLRMLVDPETKAITTEPMEVENDG